MYMCIHMYMYLVHKKIWQKPSRRFKDKCMYVRMYAWYVCIHGYASFSSTKLPYMYLSICFIYASRLG